MPRKSRTDAAKALRYAMVRGIRKGGNPAATLETMACKKGGLRVLRGYFGRSGLGRKDVEQSVRDYY